MLRSNDRDLKLLRTPIARTIFFNGVCVSRRVGERSSSIIKLQLRDACAISIKRDCGWNLKAAR